MMNYDYSIYYKRFHDESETHAKSMADWLGIYLKKELPDDRSCPVLDVGCGFGFAMRALRGDGFSNVRGIEVSAHQAEIARGSGLDVCVVSDTIQYLRDHRSQFGLVLLLDVLEHIPVPEQIDLLRAIRESLLISGRLIVTVPNANSPLSARWRYNDYTHTSSFTEHSLFFVLRNAGFGDIGMDNQKGLGAFPRFWWRRGQRDAIRKWLVRFAWLQVFKAELHSTENLDEVCFELNLKATAVNVPLKPSQSPESIQSS